MIDPCKKSQLEVIVWKDAAMHSREEDELDNLTPSEMVAHSYTYGKVTGIDEDAIVVEVCRRDTEIDCYAIPRGWIVSPQKYRK